MKGWHPPRILTALVLVLAPTMVLAADYPIELEVVSPVPPKLQGKNADPEPRLWEFRSGWLLSLKLTAKDQNTPVLIRGVWFQPTAPWPAFGELSFWVLQDLDSCPYLGGRWFQSPADVVSYPMCDDIPGDELYVEFTPDLDFIGLADDNGNPARRAALGDYTCPGCPSRPDPTALRLPGQGQGIGLGADDDLPGLVLLSNRGVGLVLSPLDTSLDQGDPLHPVSWKPPVPAEANNLAGFLTSVSYELRDQKGFTTITANLNVMKNLFQSMVVEDQCFGGDNSNFDCPDGVPAVRIDGSDVLLEGWPPLIPRLSRYAPSS